MLLNNLKHLSLYAIVASTFLMISGCLTASMPDPTTNHFTTNTVLKGAEITEAKPIALNQYKMLIVNTEIGPRFNKFIADSLINQKIFNAVETIESLSASVEPNSTSDISTKYGMKEFSKHYGKILVLNGHMAGNGIGVDYVYKIYDPSNDKTYFSVSYSSTGIPVLDILPFFNAVADWAKKYKSA